MNRTKTIQGVTLAEIPEGRFIMGHDWQADNSQSEDVNSFYPDEQPPHEVAVGSFMMGSTAVTQSQYESVMGENHSTIKGPDLPVTNMGGGEVELFCNRLSKKAGLSPCYDEESRECDTTKDGFRLPSEAEWEYACRAGSTGHFNIGESEADLGRAGWYLENSGRKIHPVALKEANAWGLFDMHGNVFEFVEDNWNPNMAYGRYLVGATMPPYNYYHDLRIVRGGSWFSEASVCRSAARSCFCNWPQLRQSWYIGFRVAKNI